MFYPSLEEAKRLAQGCSYVPIAMEVLADTETPISILKRFDSSKYAFLLESVEGGEKWGRYSFIGRDPLLMIKSFNGKSELRYNNGIIKTKEGNPLDILKEVLDKYKGASVEGIPRFSGGAVGFFGYDLARYIEHLPDVPTDDMHMPECHFMITDEVIAFDHLKQKLLIIVNMPVGGNLERNYFSALKRAKGIHKDITSSRWKMDSSGKGKRNQEAENSDFSSNITREEFCENVDRAKEYIHNGDIFQVVLSQRLKVKSCSNPLDVYRVLRGINPSPYMYYLRFDHYSIVGSSPEMLARVEDGYVETCPIAGTRPRGRTPGEDVQMEQELLADEKETAEHTMLVDLGRNDVGKVSQFGTVTVENLMHVEKFSHVMHLVTGVKGKLRQSCSSFDALISLIPAGTLSGAPKIRAMEIIDLLETTKRGAYGGAVGYIGFDGTLDTCITIRTVIFKDGYAYLQAGAGIVADSVPEKEYDECLNKAKALVTALEKAGETA